MRQAARCGNDSRSRTIEATPEPLDRTQHKCDGPEQEQKQPDERVRH